MRYKIAGDVSFVLQQKAVRTSCMTVQEGTGSIG